MPEYVATTPGLYPLPDDAKEALAGLKGHQKHDLVSGDESPEIEAAYDAARKDVVGIQRTAGVDLVVEGQLRWDDMLVHPLAVHDAVETRGLQRYYDNNNFYREPAVTGELDFDGDLAADLSAAADLTDSLQAVVPGPYSLFSLATDEHYGDEDEFLASLGEFLAGELAAAPDHEVLFVLEPSLAVDPPADDLQERASDAIDAVVTASPAETIVHTYWGAPDERTYAHLLDARLDAVGYDLVNAPDETVHNVSEYGAGRDAALGLLDGQNTAVEPPATIRERVEWFEAQTPGVDIETTYVTPNTELFYLPVETLERKLDALGTALAEATA